MSRSDFWFWVVHSLFVSNDICNDHFFCSVLFCSVLFCSVLALFCFVMFWFDLICFVLFSKMIFSIVNDPWVNCSLRYSISHYRLMAIFFSRIQNLQLFIPPMSYSSFFTSSAWFTLVLCYVTLLFTIPHFILSYHIISCRVIISKTVDSSILFIYLFIYLLIY